MEEATARRRRSWRDVGRRLWSTPGLWFHLALVPAAVTYLWSHSFPGSALGLWAASVTILAGGAAVWTVRLGGWFWFGRRRGRGHALAFAAAPLLGIVAVGAVIADIPLRLRWEASRQAFEQALEAADGDERTRRVGLYDVTSVVRRGDAVLFHEETGAFTDDAGFAYLPNGPDPTLESGSFERPAFRHLGGDWYAWTASW